jgi:sugar/nucleoside kinase (ribokinase family)
VALKLGDVGCVLATPAAAPVAITAHPAEATDTTGAGDAFCGAFMSRWLADPADLPSAARYAVRVAATVVTRFGARPSLLGS